jgi:Carboxypeptidase regulatory-like domain
VDQVDEADWFTPRRPSAGGGPAGSSAAPTSPAAGDAPAAGPLPTRGAPAGPAGAAGLGSGGARAADVPVSGSVRTADGAPITEAAVTLADLSGRQIAVARTDAGGQYRLAAPGAGSYLVIASAAGHQPAAGVVNAPGTGASHDVILRGGSGLAGTVRVEGLGQPVGGAIVTVADGRGEIAGVTTTAADGTFSLAHLAGGQYALVVAATAYTPVAVQVTVAEDQIARRDVELPASGRVAGTVMTADGDRPFPGARVSLTDVAGAEVAATAADASGQFIFNDVPSGRYTLVASGYRPGVTALHPGDARSRQADITLGPPER